MRYYLGDVEQMYFLLMKKSSSQKMKNCVLLTVVYRANTNIGGVHILRRQKFGIFWPLPPCEQFIYWTLFTGVDIWKTPHSLSFVYVDCERPHTKLIVHYIRYFLRAQKLALLSDIDILYTVYSFHKSKQD